MVYCFQLKNKNEMKTVLIIVVFLGVFACSQGVFKDGNRFENILELKAFEKRILSEIPKSVNWTALNAVSPVSQGNYLNSWTFAVASVVESRHFIQHQRMTILSKQNLIDCCWSQWAKTRHSIAALNCVRDTLGGIDTEDSYPFVGSIEHCNFNKTNIGAKVIRNFQAGRGSEIVLAYYVAKGPVVTDIPYNAIRSYRGGILKKANCDNSDKSQTMYSVLIVGYGTTDKNEDYWILKTAMGSSWGEGGYMRLARNKHNLCGITNWAYYPQVA